MEVDNINLIKTEFGEVITNELYNCIHNLNNTTLVELGIDAGASTRLLESSLTPNNNKAYGIDPISNYISNHPSYSYIQDDSVESGKNWSKDNPPSLVFFDTVHAKEQVLCELYYWWDLLTLNGWAIFHDTAWEGYIHKPGHPAAGKACGNTGLGYDSYGGIDWETPDKAVNEFFNINLKESLTFNDSFVKVFEDENILVKANYCNLGMVFVQKKSNFDFKSKINNWDTIFERQQILLNYFK